MKPIVESLVNYLGLMIFFANPAWAKKCNFNDFLNVVVNGEVQEVQIITADLMKADRSLIQKVKGGKELAYWVDANGTLRFSNIKSIKNNDGLLMVRDRASDEGLIIKEHGVFTYDDKLKKAKFEARGSVDLVEDEIESAIRSEIKDDFVRVADRQHNQARVTKCAQMMAAKEAGKNVIADNLVSGVTVTIGSFTAVEYVDWKRNNRKKEEPEDFWKWQRFKLLPFDIAATMGTSVVNGFLEKILYFKKNVGPLGTFAWESGIDYANAKLIKQPIYSKKDVIFEKLKVKEEKRNEKMQEYLPYYDTGYSMIRFYPKRVFKKFLKNSYPEIMLKACINNPAASVIAGPRTLRIIEKGAYGIGYFSIRKAIFPEQETQ